MKTCVILIIYLLLSFSIIYAQDVAQFFGNGQKDPKRYDIDGVVQWVDYSTKTPGKANKGNLTISIVAVSSGGYSASTAFIATSTDDIHWTITQFIERGNLESDQVYSVTINVSNDDQYYYMIGNFYSVIVGGPIAQSFLSIQHTIDGTPLKPTNLAKTESGSSTFLTWNEPANHTNNNNSGLVGYNIYRIPFGMNPIKLNTNLITSTSYTLPKPANGTIYATDEVYVKSVDGTGNISADPSNPVSVRFRGSELEESNEVPSHFNVYQNYPNPFNPSTKFRYYIPATSTVSISVYDLLGKTIESKIIRDCESGFHSYDFDGTGLSAGTYFFRVQYNNQSSVKVMQLVK